MIRFLTRRIAPALLLLQAAYEGLLQIAFLTLGPDTAELDHTDPSGFSPLNAALVVLTLVGLTGGAALLGLERVRSWAPCALTVTWLALLGLGQTVLAVVALATTGSPAGLTLPIALLFAAACATVAVACALTIRTGSGAVRPNTNTAD
ncbi:hypothetical protein ACFYM5_28835 [Streptomyces sp. NPDC006706]|uniref:hypothetical protein n=1 Tax=Streptomyces sp. NPDC006706 TaxID=3364761 RepID=UPI003676AF76